MTEQTKDVADSAEENDEYQYDEASAVKADDAASRITENGAYIGRFLRAEATKSANTGTKGITLAFDAPGSGNIEFTLWTRKEDGSDVFGKAQVDAIMFLMGIKGTLKSVPGKMEAWVDNADGKREKKEIVGKVFPALCEKPIGVVLQKEMYSTQKGGTGERMSLVGLFEPSTKLMMSEIKEKKNTPVKLERLIKGLKTKDTRKTSAAEPSQPAMGADGGY